MAASIAPELLVSALAREARLVQWCRDQGTIAIGYSGGVDSTYLAAVALEAVGAANVLAIVGRSASYPDSQWETARSAAAVLGLTVLEIDTDELNDPRYSANPTNRCYFCKTELWSKLVPIARERGLAVVVDGTNADDGTDHRPGAAAGRELGVRSPLAMLGFTKAEIRAGSQARGLPTWSNPSAPCLSSRIPYGSAVTPDKLRRIERAEDALRRLGITGDLRVRDHDDLARVELSRRELEHWLVPSAFARLTEAVRGTGYSRVAVDLRGFASGSLNILEGVVSA